MRINVIHPKMLADQHLVSGYREVKMLPKVLKRSLNSKKGFDFNRIPKEFTLNTGHGLFFYDKMDYIIHNFQEILLEMKSRGFATEYTSLSLENIPKELFNDYVPTKEAMKINVERILLRISDKPLWYKYRGKTLDWNEFYKEYL